MLLSLSADPVFPERHPPGVWTETPSAGDEAMDRRTEACVSQSVSVSLSLETKRPRERHQSFILSSSMIENMSVSV